MIEISGLYKRFDKLEVLKGIDLTISKGEIITIIGPSGSGKSTLLRCINALESPTAGTIHVDGVDITAPHTDINAVRMKLGFVFQNFNLFPHLSVARNIMLAPTKLRVVSPAQARDQAADLLKRVGLLDKIDAYPAQLSGGQRQRVAIARALAMNPAYMLFDEPTSALDPEMISEVLEVIRALAHQGMTMAIVTHEMGFAREISTSVALMDGGLLIEKAAPSEFFHAPKNSRTMEFISKIL